MTGNEGGGDGKGQLTKLPDPIPTRDVTVHGQLHKTLGHHGGSPAGLKALGTQSGKKM